MDSTVIGEDMEMQVVVVTHNVLPIRSLQWQNIPSSLPVKCKVYSCGRVKHKRGQQNSCKCLDKELFYPYIPCRIVSLRVVRDISPFIPSLFPVTLTRTMNLVSRVAIIKKLETKEMYWYHFSIRPSSRGRQATCSVGTKSQGFLSQNDGKMPWFALTLVRPGFQRSES